MRRMKANQRATHTRERFQSSFQKRAALTANAPRTRGNSCARSKAPKYQKGRWCITLALLDHWMIARNASTGLCMAWNPFEKRRTQRKAAQKNARKNAGHDHRFMYFRISGSSRKTTTEAAIHDVHVRTAVSFVAYIHTQESAKRRRKKGFRFSNQLDRAQKPRTVNRKKSIS